MSGSKSDEGEIVRIDASPKEKNLKERRKFGTFWRLIAPLIGEQKELGERFEEAKVRKFEGEAEKVAQEAIKISSETEVERAKGLREFCEIVDSHYSGDDSSAGMKLKMAMLLDTYPDIARQLEKVEHLSKQLKIKHGTTFEIQANTPPGAIIILPANTPHDYSDPSEESP